VGLDDRVPELVLFIAEHLLLLDLLDVDVLDGVAHVVERHRPANRVELDENRNPIENVYIKKVEKKKMFGYDKDELWNTVIKTYPKVSQFWTYGKDKFLAQPVYDRDFPPCKNCE
ncbi:MAG: hypothetical protein WBC86_17325, partial [Pseudolabrys sp.]